MIVINYINMCKKGAVNYIKIQEALSYQRFLIILQYLMGFSFEGL